MDVEPVRLGHARALALVALLVAILGLPAHVSADHPTAPAAAGPVGVGQGAVARSSGRSDLSVGATAAVSTSAAAIVAATFSPLPTVNGSGVGVAGAVPSFGAVLSVVSRLPSVVPSDGKVHRFDIGGRRLAIWCKGTGSPTVILEHGIGYGIDSDSWVTVQNGIAKEARVCRYDRAFTGESDDAKVGRSMPDLSADLVKLLAAARITGPLILVGHSFGGLVVREFAKLHPTLVAGMVLVDGSARYAIVGLDLGSERLSSTKVLAQLTVLEHPGLLGHIPLVVITRGIGAGVNWRAEQAKMVKLSTSGRQVIADDSDHWIQLRQPSLVIGQVLVAVLHTIRRHQ